MTGDEFIKRFPGERIGEFEPDSGDELHAYYINEAGEVGRWIFNRRSTKSDFDMVTGEDADILKSYYGERSSTARIIESMAGEIGAIIKHEALAILGKMNADEIKKGCKDNLDKSKPYMLAKCLIMEATDKVRRDYAFSTQGPIMRLVRRAAKRS